MWCYKGNHPFTMYENAFGRQFLKALNPAYKPPSRKFLAGHLLDSAYNIVKNILMSSLQLCLISMSVQTRAAISRVQGYAIYRIIQNLDPSITSLRTSMLNKWMPSTMQTGFEHTCSTCQITTLLTLTVLWQIHAAQCLVCGNNWKVMTISNTVYLFHATASHL